jgi:hypothetical protein
MKGRGIERTPDWIRGIERLERFEPKSTGWLDLRQARWMNNPRYILFRKDSIDDFLQALRDFFIIRQRLHYGDLTSKAGRDSRAH